MDIAKAEALDKYITKADTQRREEQDPFNPILGLETKSETLLPCI